MGIEYSIIFKEKRSTTIFILMEGVDTNILLNVSVGKRNDGRQFKLESTQTAPNAGCCHAEPRMEKMKRRFGVETNEVNDDLWVDIEDWLNRLPIHDFKGYFNKRYTIEIRVISGGAE